MTETTLEAIRAQRVKNFSRWARNLRGFADRQEARAPGRMDHITVPALCLAALAQRAANAYSIRDHAAATAARNDYAVQLARYGWEAIAEDDTQPPQPPEAA